MASEKEQADEIFNYFNLRVNQFSNDETRPHFVEGGWLALEVFKASYWEKRDMVGILVTVQRQLCKKYNTPPRKYIGGPGELEAVEFFKIILGKHEVEEKGGIKDGAYQMLEALKDAYPEKKEMTAAINAIQPQIKQL